MRGRIVWILLTVMTGGMLVHSPTQAEEAGFFASVDWLNLKARRRDMDFVLVDANANTDPEGDQLNLNYDRNNGARIGFGYHLGSGWDGSIEYQTFNTDDRMRVTQPAGGTLWGTRLHPDSVVGSNGATSAEASAALDYDVFDFTLSRRLAMDCGDHTALTLFGGFRYAMIDQTFDINYTDSVNSRTADINNPIRLDGYGIRGGGRLDWNVYGGLSVFGQGALAVLAARADATFQETDVSGGGTTTPVSVSETYYQAVPVLETAIGIGYRRNRWDVGLGYEMALWGNVAERRDFNDDVEDQKFNAPSSDLLLDGFFLRLTYNR